MIVARFASAPFPGGTNRRMSACIVATGLSATCAIKTKKQSAPACPTYSGSQTAQCRLTERVKEEQKTKERRTREQKNRITNTCTVCAAARIQDLFGRRFLFTSSSRWTYGNSCSPQSSSSILSLGLSLSSVSAVCDATSDPPSVATASNCGKSIGNMPEKK